MQKISITWGRCPHILLEDLNMQSISAKFVPQLLTDEQKEN
jgi:hypothetical protein